MPVIHGLPNLHSPLTASDVMKQREQEARHARRDKPKAIALPGDAGISATNRSQPWLLIGCLVMSVPHRILRSSQKPQASGFVDTATVDCHPFVAKA